MPVRAAFAFSRALCSFEPLARIRASLYNFGGRPVRIIMIFVGIYYLVKRAIYLSSKKIFNGGGGDHKRKKSKRKNKRNMKGTRPPYYNNLISPGNTIPPPPRQNK